MESIQHDLFRVIRWSGLCWLKAPIRPAYPNMQTPLSATFPNSNGEVGSCAAIIKDHSDEFGKWKSHLCRHERPYMCKRPVNSERRRHLSALEIWETRNHRIPASAICPAGWQSFSGSCYWLVSNTDLLTTWYEAFATCSNEGAHLLVINRYTLIVLRFLTPKYRKCQNGTNAVVTIVLF